ncbi:MULTISPECIES: LysR substrate-binding domain-containing protein [Rhizobium]|nr:MULTISPECIES: LysR substrate-binding domain-containing protein [Rhizobium]MBB4243451.1 LysR family glycine cleavage system transcriptional activator [Rhizobium tropici]MBB5593106.1 LysR family glycine cleavage system transcriptional activator [Rhizobium tropici]MBB6493707.1 LysR family glycine cleavage system transcriptional activator [Rhizobium tropici]TGE96134.1 LysR family transcriptional regulator [Rhizobium sp. SEMIA 4088]
MKLSMRFPLNALRVFEAAARHSSFTRAGEELGMTQTAVSYQIKLLEETLGEPLFLRRPRQILLTKAGEQLAPKVSEAFAMLQEAMTSIRGEVETTLCIHSTPTFASQWLARHLGSFQLKHPNIAVRLDTSGSIIDFARESADIAIRTGRGQWPGLRSHLLMKVYFTPMLSPALAESIGGIHEPADLLKLRIIDAGDPWWAQWFQEAGVPDPGLQGRPRSRLGAQSFEASAALAGQGVAILTPEFYADDLASGRLIQPFDILSSDNTDYWIAYPENRRHTPRIRAFRDWLLCEFGMPLE